MLDEDVEGLVEHLIAGSGWVADDDASGLVGVAVGGEVHPACQGQLDKVGAGEREVHVVAGRGEPTGLVVGEQEQQILGDAHVRRHARLASGT